MKSPLVSVIMPTYNGSRFIKESIDSVVNQYYQNWELIIVDDCSTDDTVSIVEEYKDSRIKLLKNKKNHGISYSTNKAIEFSKGKYISLLDHDDTIPLSKLAIQVSYMEIHDDIDVLGGRTEFINEEDAVTRAWGFPRYNPKYIKAMLLLRMCFANCSAIIRKKFIIDNNLTYKDGLLGMQDYYFFMEASKVGKFTSVPDITISHREHENNVTEKTLKLQKEDRKKIFSKIHADSFRLSGFKLSNAQLDLINYAFQEISYPKLSNSQIKELYSILQDLIRQARDMNLDYVEELKSFFRTEFVSIARKSDIFE